MFYRSLFSRINKYRVILLSITVAFTTGCSSDRARTDEHATSITGGVPPGAHPNSIAILTGLYVDQTSNKGLLPLKEGFSPHCSAVAHAYNDPYILTAKHCIPLLDILVKRATRPAHQHELSIMLTVKREGEHFAGLIEFVPDNMIEPLPSCSDIRARASNGHLSSVTIHWQLPISSLRRHVHPSQLEDNEGTRKLKQHNGLPKPIDLAILEMPCPISDFIPNAAMAHLPPIEFADAPPLVSSIDRTDCKAESDAGDILRVDGSKFDGKSVVIETGAHVAATRETFMHEIGPEVLATYFSRTGTEHFVNNLTVIAKSALRFLPSDDKPLLTQLIMDDPDWVSDPAHRYSVLEDGDSGGAFYALGTSQQMILVGLNMIKGAYRKSDLDELLLKRLASLPRSYYVGPSLVYLNIYQRVDQRVRWNGTSVGAWIQCILRGGNENSCLSA